MKARNNSCPLYLIFADDINPNDFDNVKDWLAAQMQVVINEINQPQDKPKREFPPKRYDLGWVSLWHMHRSEKLTDLYHVVSEYWPER